MAKIFGALEKAQLENLGSDPTAGVIGRIWYNTATFKIMVDDGTNNRALLRNDGYAIIGNHGTANSNVRFHRGAASVMQILLGGDTTAEGTLSTSLAQISARIENYSNATRPAAGNAGRFIYNTDEAKPQFDNGTDWGNIGSGSGGINYITAFDGGSLTGWATYADAAGVVPVDGTGGSPTVTFTSSAVSPLRETSSFVITKDAANRQGEGVGYPFTIHNADKGKTLTVKFDMEASAAFVVGDSSDVRVFFYDVTNATLIYPDSYTINSATGAFAANWVSSSSSTSYRLIFHVATTNASAWTMKLDNVQVGPSEIVKAPAMSDTYDAGPTTITATTTNPTKGTMAVDRTFVARAGDSARIRVEMQCTSGGSAGSGDFLFTLPSGLSFDSAKVSFHATLEGAGSGWLTKVGLGSATVSYNSDSVGVGVIIPYDSTRYRVGIISDPVANTWTVIGSGSFNLVGLGAYAFDFVAPISGWSTNVVSSNSQVMRMSNVLANGTRVTATPTKLGEYRTMTKNASAFTATDNAPTGTYIPSVSDGMRIDGSVLYASAGTSGQPNYWEIFVGKNKKADFQFFGNAGRTDPANIDTQVIDGDANWLGTRHGYSPETGIAWVETISQDTNTNTARAAALSYSGGTRSIHTSVYFDIIVSDNPVAVQGVPKEQTVHIKDVKASGSDGGSTTTNTYVTRVINTLENPSGYGWISLSSNQVTLSAGTYRVNIPSSALMADRHRAALYNVTDSTYQVLGTSVFNRNTGGYENMGTSFICGEFTLASTKTFDVRHRVSNGYATNGFGYAANDGNSEIYLCGTITKLNM